MSTSANILWHCCIDCDAGSHKARCGGGDNDLGRDSQPLENFLNPVINRCQECYDMLSPLEILSNIEL